MLGGLWSALCRGRAALAPPVLWQRVRAFGSKGKKGKRSSNDQVDAARAEAGGPKKKKKANAPPAPHAHLNEKSYYYPRPVPPTQPPLSSHFHAHLDSLSHYHVRHIAVDMFERFDRRCAEIAAAQAAKLKGAERLHPVTPCECKIYPIAALIVGPQAKSEEHFSRTYSSMPNFHDIPMDSIAIEKIKQLLMSPTMMRTGPNNTFTQVDVLRVVETVVGKKRRSADDNEEEDEGEEGPTALDLTRRLFAAWDLNRSGILPNAEITEEMVLRVTEAFATLNMGDTVSYHALIAALEAARDRPASMVELEENLIEYRIDSQSGKVAEVLYDHGRGIERIDHTDLHAAGFRSIEVPKFELHHGFDILKHDYPHKLPVGHAELMRQCSAANFHNGGWFIFSKPDLWAYRSNEFSDDDLETCKVRLLQQAEKLQKMVCGFWGVLPHQVQMTCSLERVLGIWPSQHKSAVLGGPSAVPDDEDDDYEEEEEEEEEEQQK